MWQPWWAQPSSSTGGGSMYFAISVPCGIHTPHHWQCWGIVDSIGPTMISPAACSYGEVWCSSCCACCGTCCGACCGCGVCCGACCCDICCCGCCVEVVFVLACSGACACCCGICCCGCCWEGVELLLGEPDSSFSKQSMHVNSVILPTSGCTQMCTGFLPHDLQADCCVEVEFLLACAGACACCCGICCCGRFSKQPMHTEWYHSSLVTGILPHDLHALPDGFGGSGVFGAGKGHDFLAGKGLGTTSEQYAHKLRVGPR